MSTFYDVARTATDYFSINSGYGRDQGASVYGVNQGGYTEEPQAISYGANTRKPRRRAPKGAFLQRYETTGDASVLTDNFQSHPVGAAKFQEFERNTERFIRELGRLSLKAQQIRGSLAIGMLSSSAELQKQLSTVLKLFNQNASALFPREIKGVSSRRFFKSRVLMDEDTASSHIDFDETTSATFDRFPEHLQELVESLSTLYTCLNDFSDVTAEALDVLIPSLIGDLTYWASVLDEYEGRFNETALKLYLHDMTAFSALSSPKLRTGFQTLWRKFSFEHKGTPLEDAVNGFWLTSLVLSVGATINGLLSLSWKRVLHQYEIPAGILIWVTRSPLILIAMAFACFSVGLVLFVFSSGQHRITSVFIAVLSACSFLFLTILAVFVVFARGNFNRRNSSRSTGRRPATRKRSRSRFIQGVSRILKIWFMDPPRKALKQIKNSYVFESRHTTILPTASRGSESHVELRHVVHSAAIPPSTHQREHTDTTLNHPPIIEGKVPGQPPKTRGPHHNYHARFMWRKAIYQVIQLLKNMPVTKVLTTPNATPEAPTNSESIPELKRRFSSMKMDYHKPNFALIRDLKFSSDGTLLATSGADLNTTILKVEDWTCKGNLVSPDGFSGQIAWSPKGSGNNKLIVKLNRGVKVWEDSTNGAENKEVSHRDVVKGSLTVQSISWCPNGDAFLYVQGRRVNRRHLHGEDLAVYDLDNISLRDVAITWDDKRMICVGSVITSPKDYQRENSPPLNHIIVYNLESHQVDSHVPVFNHIEKLSITKDDKFILVSYDQKECPPQLWELVETKEGVTTITFRHAYLPNRDAHFTGPSCFGGKDDELVLGVHSEGIHIWHRDLEALIYCIPSPQKELTRIAWNSSHEFFMIAAGAQDGSVFTWHESNSSEGGDGNIGHLETRPDKPTSE